MKWRLLLLSFVVLAPAAFAQQGVIGLQVNLYGKVELVFDEPNLRGYIQDTVWVTENNETYATDVVNMLYQFGTLCEKGEDLFVATNLDPSFKFSPEYQETGFSSNQISDSLIQIISYSDLALGHDTQSSTFPCGDWVMGYNIANEQMPMIHQELEEYCKIKRLLDDDDLEREAFRDLLLKFCAMDENNYISDSAEFVLDRCQLHTCRHGILQQVYCFSHDSGVSHYSFSYNEYGDIIRFEQYIAGFVQIDYFLNYDDARKVVNCVSKFRDTNNDNSVIVSECQFGYDIAGRMNRFLSVGGTEVTMHYGK
jgi:hypothetical protein